MNIGARVQELIDRRDELSRELSDIEEKLDGIQRILGVEIGRSRKVHTDEPKLSATVLDHPRKGKSLKFKRTGEQTIEAVVSQFKNPTTAMIAERWSKEGRGGKPDSLLSQMVKDGKLKRDKVEGERGSRYSYP